MTEESLKTQLKSMAENLKMKVILLRFLARLPKSQLFAYEEKHYFVERNKNKCSSDIINDIAGEVTDKLSNFNREKLKKIFDEQKSQVEDQWTDIGILKLCPGKDLLRLINNWTLNEFKININSTELIGKLEKVDDDIINLLDKIIKIPKKQNQK